MTKVFNEGFLRRISAAPKSEMGKVEGVGKGGGGEEERRVEGLLRVLEDEFGEFGEVVLDPLVDVVRVTNSRDGEGGEVGKGERRLVLIHVWEEEVEVSFEGECL